jgi:hypothetical protein
MAQGMTDKHWLARRATARQPPPPLPQGPPLPPSAAGGGTGSIAGAVRGCTAAARSSSFLELQIWAQSWYVFKEQEWCRAQASMRVRMKRRRRTALWISNIMISQVPPMQVHECKSQAHAQASPGVECQPALEPLSLPTHAVRRSSCHAAQSPVCFLSLGQGPRKRELDRPLNLPILPSL